MLGGVAGALLAMLKLKEALVPDAGQQVTKDIATIRADNDASASPIAMA